jgi:hypothetical protein
MRVYKLILNNERIGQYSTESQGFLHFEHQADIIRHSKIQGVVALQEYSLDNKKEVCEYVRDLYVCNTMKKEVQQ